MGPCIEPALMFGKCAGDGRAHCSAHSSYSTGALTCAKRGYIIELSPYNSMGYIRMDLVVGVAYYLSAIQ